VVVGEAEGVEAVGAGVEALVAVEVAGGLVAVGGEVAAVDFGEADLELADDGV
jgi:hypothetical protein